MSTDPKHTAPVPHESGGHHSPQQPAPKIWECKVGEVHPSLLPRGSDAPMRSAVERAFFELTGVQPAFCFSGWGATLTEGERAVVEDRLPRRELTGCADCRERDATIATLTARAEEAEAKVLRMDDVVRTLRDTDPLPRLMALTLDRDRLQRFKDYCHKRMDEAGIEADPESPHRAAGCRIGGRFDALISQGNAARAEASRLRKALEHIAAGNISPAIGFARDSLTAALSPAPGEAPAAWPPFDSRFLRREPGAECSQATVDVHSYLRTHPAFEGRVWAAHLRDRATGEDHVVALVDLTREVASSKWSLEDVRDFPAPLAPAGEGEKCEAYSYMLDRCELPKGHDGKHVNTTERRRREWTGTTEIEITPAPAEGGGA